MSEKKSIMGWPIVNFLAYIFMIIVNSLANIVPFNGRTTGELSDAIPNYIVPAGYVFSIWGVIYVFTGIFAVYQLLPTHREASFQRAINPWFFIGSIANGVWIFLWHWIQIPLSLVVMLVLLVSLLTLYLRLNIGKPEGEQTSRKEKIATQVPFSIYLGWITVATIANVTAVLVTAGVPGLDDTAIVWTVIILAVIALITVLMLWLRKDIAYALVIAWAVGGVLNKQLAVIPVAVTAGLVLSLVTVGIVWTLLKSRK